MPSRQKIIDGVPYEITEPYLEGHVCTLAEARALNQLRSENIGNNVRAKVKELHEAGKKDEAAILVRQTDAEYTFISVGSSTRGQKLEPVEREARNIAIELLKNKLAETGRKIDVPPSDHSAETWAQHVESKINEISCLEAVLALAQKRIDQRRELTKAVA